MGELLTHILQTTISIIILFAIYWVFLKKDTFFSLNRFYLLGALAFSVVIPFFKINFGLTETNTTFVIFLETIQISADKIERSFFQNMNVYETILIVYFTGASLFLIRLLFQLGQLIYFISRSNQTKLDKFRLIYHKKYYLPFSFFNLIFVNKEKLNENDFTDILVHEKAHSNQLHTLDLIFLELLTIFQWFNPFIWLYRSSIKGIHEYLADEGLLAGGMNKKNYQNLLLNHTVGLQVNFLTNNFNQSLIKKRFIMMKKTQTKKLAWLKFLLVLPVASILIICFAFSANKEVFSSGSLNTNAITTMESTMVSDQDVKTETDEKEIFQVVENMPQFVGGVIALQKFLAANIKYPEVARKAGIQGRVYVSYVVEIDGSITGIRVIRGISRGCNEEAVRVVSLMPKWIPGKKNGEAVRVQFNLPIRFVLDNKLSVQEEIAKIEKNVNRTKITYRVVEEMPKFKSTDMTQAEFITANIKYPEAARKAKTQGKVFVTFVVEKDGSVTGIKLLRGIGNGCDEEALRVVKLMTFTPGKQRGEKVDV